MGTTEGQVRSKKKEENSGGEVTAQQKNSPKETVVPARKEKR